MCATSVEVKLMSGWRERRTLAVAEESGEAQPSFWALCEELRIVTTIPTFLIIVLQVNHSSMQPIPAVQTPGSGRLVCMPLSAIAACGCCNGHMKKFSLALMVCRVAG